MLGYLLRRVLAAIPVMGVVALFVFLLLRLTPGDPAAILAGDNATPEQLERIRVSLGLNEPLYTQFFTWIGKLLHGDLGVSLISNVPVLQNDRPARRAVDLDRAVDHHPFHPDRRAARRDRGVETRHLDRPLRDGIVGGRLLGPGIRDRLRPDPDFRHRPALAAGAGFQKHHRGFRSVPRAHHPADLHAVLHLCRPDRAHDARIDAGCAGRGLCPHRARQGHQRERRAAAPRAAQRRRARHHRDRHRLCAVDLRRRRHRERVQPARRRTAHRRCRAGARLSGDPGDDPADVAASMSPSTS